jgi:hypothetical protein
MEAAMTRSDRPSCVFGQSCEALRSSQGSMSELVAIHPCQSRASGSNDDRAGVKRLPAQRNRAKTNGPTVTRLKNPAKELTFGTSRSAILVRSAGVDHRRDGSAWVESENAAF